MTFTEIDLLLAAGKQAPSEARRCLDELRGTLSRERLEHARLLVTELVTNAFLHGSRGTGDETIRLRVTMPDGALRVEVTDSGPGFEPPAFTQAPPSPGGFSGRGLYLVDSLSERWGVSGRGPACVWFELARESGVTP